MPANWITDRPSVRRRPPAREEAPRLQLPLHRPLPVKEQAQQRSKAEPETKRGAVVVDFYI